MLAVLNTVCNTQNTHFNWFKTVWKFHKRGQLTVQSADSSLNGFHDDGDVFANDVDNCWRITVSRSERDRFISALGLSFSLLPGNYHGKMDETPIRNVSFATMKLGEYDIIDSLDTFALCSGCFAFRKIDPSTIRSKSWSWLLPSHKLFSAGNSNFVSDIEVFSILFRIYRIKTPHASVICSIWLWHTAHE